MGRRPKLKSGEFFISTSRVEEQTQILCLKRPKKCYTVGEHDPARSRPRRRPPSLFVARLDPLGSPGSLHRSPGPAPGPAARGVRVVLAADYSRIRVGTSQAKVEMTRLRARD